MEHGFPARLIVPGLYGYVSATKWLSSLSSTLEGLRRTGSRAAGRRRRRSSRSRASTRRRAARAWRRARCRGGHPPGRRGRGHQEGRGRVDGKEWQEATLATRRSSATTWVQWKWTWQATARTHFIEVRATDGTDEVQADKVTPPDPDGARSHHQVQVQVSR
ncbi:MAG: molybdopterin-dependent oxidoreductase [Chloroflexota bacterium]